MICIFRQRAEVSPEAVPGVPPWMSGLLRARGVSTREEAKKFLHPSLDDLHDPMLLKDMDRAVSLIRGAIARGERILVYGDYDVDGISACVIMTEMLREEGADVCFRIPSRHSEGYGLNAAAVEEIAESGVKLLITVDCGISGREEVRLAREKGMKVIVTDHHELPDRLPEADAVIDPLLGDYPFRRLCGAGVALKICQAMQGRQGVLKRLEVAALATVADIVPLIGENRVIVSEGLRRMADTKRPGLRALMDRAGVKAPRASDIAFRLAPRLNAAGRLEDAKQGADLLLTEDPAEAARIADHLEENNVRRQGMEQRIFAEAQALMKSQADLRRERVIIVAGENWNRGLIGLAAGKLCERYHHPAIVLSLSDERDESGRRLAVGSCRSVPGVNIWDMLNRCADLFVRFGGHEQAAGLTVAEENIPELRRRLNRVVRENCSDLCFYPVEEYDSELALKDVTVENIGLLEAFEPTGCGNPAPAFLVRGAQVQEARKVGKDQSHLKLTLEKDGAVRGGIAFGQGGEADRALDRVDAVYRAELNEFNGRVSPQVQVRALKPSGEDGVDAESLFPALLQEMSRLAAKKTGYGSDMPGLKPEDLLKERTDRLNMTDEKLREVYRALREALKDGRRPASPEELGKACGLERDQMLTALQAFGETGLVKWRMNPFRAELVLPARRCSMTDSPLIRRLRGL